jgi:hypothetical protein
MLPSDDCDECTPDYGRHTSSAHLTTYALFIVTFVSCAYLALRKGLPRLAAVKDHSDEKLPIHNLEARDAAAAPKWSVKRLVSLAFAANFGFSAVLVEILLCEISNALDPAARSLALRVTIPSLMVLLILVSPALLIQSVLTAVGLNFGASGKRRARMAWAFEAVAVGLWLFGFWSFGHIVLRGYMRGGEESLAQNFLEGCLERIGIIGITLMASLSGFAAVSAVWQTFIVKTRVVTENDIARRQSALQASIEMLATKRSRLRGLELRMSDSPSGGFLSSMAGALRGTTGTSERSTLAMEITGLESMRLALNSSLYIMQTRRTEQQRAHTHRGRLLIAFSYLFSLYCVYRLGSTSVSFLRRSFVSHNALHHTRATAADPVTSVQAMLADHWAGLGSRAWTRQMSFLLSGVMLLASFNSALQTFLLLSRAFPSLAASAAAFRDATTLALLISDVVATYVISSAILLRGNLPSDVGNVISVALSAPLEAKRVDAWFESWFLGSAVLTAVGVWIVKRVGEGMDDDGDSNVEMQKQS